MCLWDHNFFYENTIVDEQYELFFSECFLRYVDIFDRKWFIVSANDLIWQCEECQKTPLPINWTDELYK